MKTIAILSQKGGAGKTTLAIHLAVASELAGRRAAIVDLDPQASATSWKDHRTQEAPAVVSAQAARLAYILATAEEHGTSLSILDTAPNSESAALTAARAADLILIPCRPALLDLKAIGFTVDVVRLANKPAVVILNATPTRGTLADEARVAVERYNVPVAPVHLGYRIAYIHALTAGQTVQEYEPESKAAEEVTQFYTWLCTQVHL
jgi:chromosome partitioning protein